MSPTPGFNTRAIHAGQDPDPATGAVIVPVHLTTTYKQDGVGGLRGGYEYSRSANPTRTALQEALAALEEGATGLAFASGLAAEDTLLRTVCEPGSHIVLGGDAYGGTFRLISRVASRWGVEHTPADLNDLDALRSVMRPTTRVIWCETPTNPLLNIADIARLAEFAHEQGALLVVDNTFASPYLQQPLTLGADVVVHSTTKYLGGHSDVVGGVVVGNDPDVYDVLKFHQNAAGAVPSPFDCWLTLRGIKTLAVRMDRHSANARAVAAFLREHEGVDRVFYPGLPEHSGHALAARQMRDYSGMVSFTTRGGYEAAAEVVGRTKVFQLAESLGGVESLIEHPGLMTHASVAGTKAEVEDTLLRLSVGIENEADLVGDLRQALEVVVPATALR